MLDTALVALRSLDSSDFEESSTAFPQPYSLYAAPADSSPFDLPSVLVPPEIIELDGLSTDAGEDAQVKKEEWPEFFLRLFDTGVRDSLCLFIISSVYTGIDNTRSNDPARLHSALSPP